MTTDMKSYMASLTIFGKTSDKKVNDLLKSVVTVESTDPYKMPQSSIDDYKNSINPVDKSQIGKDYNGLLRESMIINNKISNKSITLRDQKKIVRSNYTIIDIGHYIEREVQDIPKIVTDTIKKTNPVKNLLEIQNVLDDIGKNLDTLKRNLDFDVNSNKRTFEQYYGYLNNDLPQIGWAESKAYEWINNTINDDSSKSFRFNYDVYKTGDIIHMQPKYGKYTASAISVLANRYIVKLSSYRRDKKTGRYEYNNDSYFQKKGINFKINEDIALKLSATDSERSKNLRRIRNNPFITDLMNAGPDLNQNMFDVYLRFNNQPSHPSIKPDTEYEQDPNPIKYLYFTPIMSVNSKGKIKHKTNYVLESTFKDSYSLSVRTATVNIPLINRETTSLKFLNTSIDIPTNSVTFNNEANLSVDCDANTYVNDMFLALSGLQRDGQFRDGKAMNLVDIQSDMFNRFKNHYPFMAPARIGFQMNSIDIVVTTHGLGLYTDKTVNSGGGGFYSDILYVFKDVRFQGVDSDIQFSTENAASQTIETKFIFKRLEHYYKPDNLQFAGAPTNNVIRSSLFNYRNLHNTYYDEISITETEDLPS